MGRRVVFVAYGFSQPRSLGVEPMRLKLVKKLANTINGLDLTNVTEGAVLVVTPRQAAILVSAGWAEETTHVPGTLLNLQPRKES
jgi:hypothetical protein